jgi:hypothetical protein
MSDMILPPISVTASAPGYSDTPSGLPFPAPIPAIIFKAQQQERNAYYGKGLWREMILKIMHEQHGAMVNGVISGLSDSVVRDLQTLSYADSYLAQNPHLTPAQALTFITKQVNDPLQTIPKASDLSGSILTPVAALGHFLFGKGTPLVADLPSLSLSPSVTPVPDLNTALAQAPIGTSMISLDKVAYNTANDSWITGSWLGNITLKIEGAATKGTDGSLSFSGTARSYNDIYDANPGTWRNWMDEKATDALAAIQRHLGAKPYEIQIQGTIPIEIHR